MHPDLENIVNSLLSKGEITERSRELLMKKAEQLGVDAIDFELDLEGRIAESKTRTNAPSPPSPQTNKERIIKKCPGCGAVADSFSTKCKECGHEFRSIELNNSVKLFFEKYEELQFLVANELKANPRKIGDRTFPIHEAEINAAVCDRRANLIDSFPILNTKEDILEFLSIAVPESKKKLSFIEIPKKNLRKAWTSKAEQIIMKARFAMKDDKKTLEEIEVYAKELGI